MLKLTMDELSSLGVMCKTLKYTQSVEDKGRFRINTTEMVQHPLRENEYYVKGDNGTYIVTTANGEAVHCSCPAQTPCYHMAMVDLEVGAL